MQLFTVIGFLSVFLNESYSLFAPASIYPSSEDVRKIVYMNEITDELKIQDKDIAMSKGMHPVAHVSFKNKINSTGWSFLKIRTNASFPDALQARAAGYAEGYVTSELMTMHYKNLLESICSEDPSYCERLEVFLKKNRKWIESQTSVSHRDPTARMYWHQVSLIYHQADGIVEGYRKSPQNENLPDIAFELLQLQGDEASLEVVLKRKTLSSLARYGHCSALVKVLPDHSDLLVSHNTWIDYKSMLRIMKYYNFKFHLTNKIGAERVASEVISFSSYPGGIASTDDFNMMSSGLVSQETTIYSFDNSFLKEVVPESVLEWARSVVANRLAYSGNEWTHLFSMHNSGTYNNQWMVIDYNRFVPGREIQSETLWIIEQITGLVEMADVSVVLKEKGYWASFNVPYFTLIYNISGYPFVEKMYGPEASYTNNARAKIFRRDQKNVHDMTSLFKLMRYNDFKHDPLSRCNCTPPYTADFAIASRGDLNDKNGVYPMDFLGFKSEGATDCKATSFKRMKHLEAVVVSSPTYDQQPPFQWSKTEWHRPLGHPDLWKFDTIATDWSDL